MNGAPAFVQLLQRNAVPRRRLMRERFGVIATLGRGSFGEVLLVEDRQANGALAVVKRSRRPEEEGGKKGVAAEQLLRAAVTEALIMARFNDDGIVRLMDFWYDESEGGVCFLMEYCAGGDLEMYLRRAYPLSEELLRMMFLQCLLALAHMHTKEVIHRDVKPSNILLSGGKGKLPTLKVADFGLSAICDSNTTVDASLCVGTPLYMSPETVAEGVCGYGSDVWSLGVVFYRMMTNRQPFTGDDFDTLRFCITSMEPQHANLRSPVRYSRALGDLVMSMLAKHPFVRPTARQLIASPLFTQALSHSPWRSRPLRGSLCLFVCHTNHAVHIFAEPRADAEIVATLNFADHVFVTCEVHTRTTAGQRSISRSGARGVSPDTSTAAGDLRQDVAVWCRVVGPREGYCAKYDRGRGLLRHVADCTPCGPLLSETCVAATRASSPEPVRPTEVVLTPSPPYVPPREKARGASSGNLLSALFKQCG